MYCDECGKPMDGFVIGDEFTTTVYECDNPDCELNSEEEAA